MAEERFLVTGAAGCIGAWVVARLVNEGAMAVAFDASDNDHRLRLLLDEHAMAAFIRVKGDIRDGDQLNEVISDHSITHVIHLAALQVPACKADPILGAQVNVTGTVNVFEAARLSDGQVRGMAYASSAAVFGSRQHYQDGIARDTDVLVPETLYGIFKQANEGTARMYASDWGVGSVGLRPCVVYGPGRDQGLTSDPSKAMLAAAAGQSGRIAFGGSSTFHHADDVAAAFVAVARLEVSDAIVHNVGGTNATVADVAAAVEQAVPGVKVAFGEQPLPLAPGLDGSGLTALLQGAVEFRSLERGVRDSIDQFHQLLESGRIDSIA